MGSTSSKFSLMADYCKSNGARRNPACGAIRLIQALCDSVNSAFPTLKLNHFFRTVVESLYFKNLKNLRASEPLKMVLGEATTPFYRDPPP